MVQNSSITVSSLVGLGLRSSPEFDVFCLLSAAARSAYNGILVTQGAILRFYVPQGATFCTNVGEI